MLVGMEQPVPPEREHIAAPAPPVRNLVVMPARMRLFVPSRAWGGRRRREILFAAAGIAVLFHVLLTIGILEAPRLWPRPPSVPSDASQQEPPSIEMVMDQNRYAGGSKPTPPQALAPPAPKAPPAPPKPQAAPTPSDLSPPTATTRDTESLPPDAPVKGEVQAPTPAPPQQPAPEQPQVDLDPADGLGYGKQDDPQIIPASPDDHNANKMPPYPRSAGRRGEEGSVQMLVSIAADGMVSGIEVAVSSGYPDLDRTAVGAVSRWHFRPAVQGGVAVPTRMMQVFNFHIDR